MNKLLLFCPLLVAVAHATFVVVPRCHVKCVTQRNTVSSRASHEFEMSSSSSSQPSLVVQPKSVWVEESAMSQALHCAQSEECDPNEMLYHFSSLMQLNDECVLQQAFELLPTNSECDDAKDRRLIQRILQLKYELHGLKQELEDSTFANTVKKQHEAKVQNHWYTDYMDFYHM